MPRSINPLISVSAGALVFGTVASVVIPNTPALVIASTVGALVGSALANRKEPPSPQYIALLEQNQAILAAIDTLPRELPPIDLGAIIDTLQTHQNRLDSVMTLTEATLNEVKRNAAVAEMSAEKSAQELDYTPLLEANQNSLVSIKTDLDLLKNCLLDALIKVSQGTSSDSTMSPTTKIDIEIKYRDEQGEPQEKAIQIQDFTELAELHVQESVRCVDTAFKSLAYSKQAIRSGDSKILKLFIMEFFNKIVDISKKSNLLRKEGADLNPALVILDQLFGLNNIAHFNGFSGRPAAYVAHLLKDTEICLIYHDQYSSVIPYTTPILE